MARRNALIVLILTALFTIFLNLRWGQPIYTDDISSLVLSSRYLTEGGRGTFLMPHCADALHYELPSLWKPFAAARSLSASYLASSVLGLDFFVALRALAATILIALLALSGMKKPHEDMGFYRFAITPVLLLGTVPSFMVMARPETTIIILFLLSILLTLEQHRLNKYLLNALPLFQLLIFVWGLTLHSQVAIFTPLFLLLTLYSGKNRLIVFVSVLLIAYSAVFSSSTWMELSTCPLNTSAGYFFSIFTIRPGDLLQDPTVIARAFAFFLDSLQTPFSLTFTESFPSHMLVANNHLPKLARLLLNIPITATALLVLCSSIFYFLDSMLTDWKAALKEKRLLIALTLMLCFFLWSTLRGKGLYLLPLMHGCIATCFVLLAPLSASQVDKTKISVSLFKICSLLLIPTAILSLGLNSYYFGGFNNGFRDSYGPISHIHNSFYRTPLTSDPEHTTALMESCGLNQVPKQNIVVVDDSTYFLLAERANLSLFLYTMAPGWSAKETQMLNLEGLGARGFLLPCFKLDPKLSNSSHFDIRSDSGLCCAAW